VPERHETVTSPSHGAAWGTGKDGTGTWISEPEILSVLNYLPMGMQYPSTVAAEAQRSIQNGTTDMAALEAAIHKLL
jgi:hypothetical protein